METNKTQTEQLTQDAVSRRLFRGYSKKINDWVYGDLIYTPSGEFRILNFTFALSDSITETYTINELVEKKSVGQFSGVFDKKGNNIYEGDIISDEEYERQDVIVFENGCFGYINDYGFLIPFNDTNLSIVKVVGNIYENSLAESTS
jgi:hypothetical protein